MEYQWRNGFHDLTLVWLPREWFIVNWFTGTTPLTSCVGGPVLEIHSHTAMMFVSAERQLGHVSALKTCGSSPREFAACTARVQQSAWKTCLH